MKISRTKFWLIVLIILLLPFSKNWRLLLFGISTYGEVLYHREISLTKGYYTYSIIEFIANEQKFQIRGPANVIYPVGKKIKIKYDKSEPTNYITLNLSTIYLGNQMIIPGILLILWLAFYWSFKQNKNLKERNTK